LIEKLTIKNYLLLKNIEIDFSEGFNVITGETGAGKSILIDALSLLLGERADYSIIGKNKEKMIVEAFINLSNDSRKQIEKSLSGSGVEEFEGNTIIVRRELYVKGYSRNFINDSPVNINDLKKLGEAIIDIHSQNEHQSLLKKEVHIELLDSYLKKIEKLKFEKLINEYSLEFSKLCDTVREYDEIIEKKNEIDSKRNYVEFQLKEINEVDPQPGEDEELEKELKASENIEVIQQGLSAAYVNLYDDAGSVSERIKIAEKELSKLQEYNSDIVKILNDISAYIPVLDEASRQLHQLMQNLSFDPEKVEQIRERLYKLQFLKKKYGNNIAGIIELKNRFQSDLSLADNFDEKISSLEKDINSAKESLFKKAQNISKLRKENSEQLSGEIAKILKEVGFENAEFTVSVVNPTLTLPKGEGIGLNDDAGRLVKTKGGYIKLSENGIDDVEFLVKINKGDEFSSLRKSASGGEVSRIMLAIKTVLADADNVDTLVFDEIDIGISGRIAQKVGNVVKKLAGYHQVISVTHLAQIAALAEKHFLVEKEVQGEVTITKIRPLEKNEKVIEVAKLLSGEKVTDASIKSAKELMS